MVQVKLKCMAGFYIFKLCACDFATLKLLSDDILQARSKKGRQF